MGILKAQFGKHKAQRRLLYHTGFIILITLPWLPNKCGKLWGQLLFILFTLGFKNQKQLKPAFKLLLRVV